MGDSRFERLTDGQKECLRLFHARWEVKDIARHIGRSPVTVNQRLAAARQHLGVNRSVEAARLLNEHEGGLYDPPIYEPEIVAEPQPDGAPTLERTAGFPLPFPTRGRPRNDLTFAGKLVYSLVLSAIIALVFGGSIAALSGLSELF
jgi:DNA-binding CsgD family transcriptional regulator